MCSMLVTPALCWRSRQILRAHWPTRLKEMVSSSWVRARVSRQSGREGLSETSFGKKTTFQGRGIGIRKMVRRMKRQVKVRKQKI